MLDSSNSNSLLFTIGLFLGMAYPTWDGGREMCVGGELQASTPQAFTIVQHKERESKMYSALRSAVLAE